MITELIGAAVGIGLSLFGSSEEEKQQKKAAQAAKKAAKEQKKFAEAQNKIIDEKIKPLLTQQGEAQEKASAESRKAEELRRTQMRLDAARTRRDIIRNMSIARSIAVTRANAQTGGGGAAFASDSGFFGSLSQITSEGTRQKRGVAQNLAVGEGIFSANIATSEFLSEANKFGTQVNLAQADIQTLQNEAGAKGAQSSANVNAIASQHPGSFYTNLGSSILSTLPSISKLGTSALFGSSSNYYSGPNNGYFYDFAANDPFYPVYN